MMGRTHDRPNHGRGPVPLATALAVAAALAVFPAVPHAQQDPLLVPRDVDETRLRDTLVESPSDTVTTDSSKPPDRRGIDTTDEERHDTIVSDLPPEAADSATIDNSITDPPDSAAVESRTPDAAVEDAVTTETVRSEPEPQPIEEKPRDPTKARSETPDPEATRRDVLFATIPGFAQPLTDSDDLMDIDATIPILRRWSLLSGATIDWRVPWLVGANPLAWPPVFAGGRGGSRLMADRLTDILERLPIDATPLPFDGFGASADAISRALANGTPVLRNAPRLPLYYGFDAREPGTFWYAEIGGASSLLLDIDRRKLYWYWDDDPAANLAWTLGTERTDDADTDKADRDWRRALPATLAVSTKTDSAENRFSYVPQIRRFIERLENDDRLPALLDHSEPADPLGLHRLATARRAIAGALGGLADTYKDTARAKPLSRAAFYYDRSASEIERAIVLLYGFDHQRQEPSADSLTLTLAEQFAPRYTVVDLFALETRWGQKPMRGDIAGYFSTVLRWEKRAFDEIAAYDRKFPLKKSSRAKR